LGKTILEAEEKCQKNVKEVSRVVKSREIVCYLHLIMNNSTKYLVSSLALVIFFFCIVSCKNDSNKDFSEVTKVALRDVGHKLLLINQDSTSLVKPVLELEDQKYQLSFQESVSIHPDSLVNVIKNSFQKSGLPKYYLTEVTQCEDGEVAYSYEMKEDVDKDIVPCGGRQLRKACYIVSVRFTQSINSKNNSLTYLLYVLIAAMIIMAFILYKYRAKNSANSNNGNYASIGSFQFYPEQNKLVKQAEEISLSKKECELLAIFASQPNQIVKREDLMKQVWEDNGVIVGRSLDTYISKLRKKLQTDKSIKLTNVHGVGYKLEVD